MSDYIKREDAVKKIRCVNTYGDKIGMDVREECRLLLTTMPAVDVEPVRHGKWEYHSNRETGINPEDAYCSCCGFHIDTTCSDTSDEYNYCPNCGALMKEG